jgi:hypothetical protein
MRKLAVLAALMVAVALPNASYAAKKMAAADPAVEAQKNTADLMRDAFNPYDATKPQPAKGKRHHKM